MEKHESITSLAHEGESSHNNWRKCNNKVFFTLFHVKKEKVQTHLWNEIL